MHKFLRESLNNCIREIMNTQDTKERLYAIGLFTGYLNGLKMSEAITKAEYDRCFNTITDIVRAIEND